MATVSSSVHGFPRIGPRRELKFALERYWAQGCSAEQLDQTARGLRAANWQLMRAAGIELIPSNDFSLYDHVLDAIALVGAVPPRYGPAPAQMTLDLYFEMARGGATTAMEMTKWFDTNYHHIVPELGPHTRFALSDTKPFDQFREARELGLTTKPMLLGPVSFLLLAKPGEGADADFRSLSLLDALLDVYAEVIARLGEMGARWLALEEPCFAEDRDAAELAALTHACERLSAVEGRPKLCVCTYFDQAGEALAVLADAPIEGVGLDLVRGRADVERLRRRGGLARKTLFAGVVDARSVWIDDLDASLRLLEELRTLCDELVVSSSASLMHIPYRLHGEWALDGQLRSWLAFAHEKTDEVALLARALIDGADAVAAELDRNRRALADRRASPRTRDAAVRERLATLDAADEGGREPFERRCSAQRERLKLPALPTTTIGSFPQTAELRATRAAWRRGEIDQDRYERHMRAEIERTIRLQEHIGLDVLVHGEPERDDMVRYFAAQLAGFAFTEQGWVQSYGSRCVRPPILFGDVQRMQPITVGWTAYAQSLTNRPVKGMLTGPVTMLQWSFVRDDQPRELTCRQLALVVRDELDDLQRAGLSIVQVDEPAIREGLPLRDAARERYLRWAVSSFRLATAVAQSATQIQTHMCYSDFGEIMGHIVQMDADVLLIEAARSRMDLLAAFAAVRYPNDIGPGVWDIHSPRVPPVQEIETLLARAERHIDRARLWVNPDCGLKTRDWSEVVPALEHLVTAARNRRHAHPAASSGEQAA